MDLQSRRRFLSSLGQLLAVGTVGTAFAPGTLAGSIIDRTNRRTWSMGTIINLTLPDAPPTSAFTQAFESLYRVDGNLSAHQKASDLSGLNSSASEWYSGCDDLLAVARAARTYGDLTRGAFDVTVLPAMQRLGFVPGSCDISPTELSENIDYTRLQVGAGVLRIDSGFGVDFGGIAKGYAVDEAIGVLKGRGMKAALLEAGGDIYAHGRPSSDRMWSVGVRNPHDTTRIAAKIEVENEAIATSGTYLHTRKLNGRKVGHLIDPRSGLSVNNVLSCSVVAQTTIEADVLATAASILPKADGLDLIQRTAGAEGVWIYDDGSVEVSAGLRRRIEWM